MEEKAVERDFEKEVHDLYEAKPELRGKQLPEEVVKACVEGENLCDAYGAYAQKQTEKPAPMAPVRSVTLGGGVENVLENMVKYFQNLKII